jgi:hypothetical protein
MVLEGARLRPRAEDVVRQREVWGQTVVSPSPDAKALANARMSPPDAVFEPAPDTQPLNPRDTAQAWGVVLRRAVFRESAIELTDWAKAKLGLQGLLGSKRDPARDAEALASLGRLLRGPAGFDAFCDPGTGQVSLREKVIPLPSSVQAPAPDRTRPVLESFVASQLNAPEMTDAVGMMARVLPPDAVRLLQLSGLKMDLTREVEPRNREERRFGPYLSGRPLPSSPDSPLGSFSFVARSINVNLDKTHLPAVRYGTFLHEVAHALDWALGGVEAWSTTDPEWLAAFEASKPDLDAGTPSAFPTWHSSLSPEEFFAECSAIFLAGQVEQHGQVTTRADLQRINPRAYALMEKVFADLIPARLAEPNLESRLKADFWRRVELRMAPEIQEKFDLARAAPDGDTCLGAILRLVDLAVAGRSTELLGKVEVLFRGELERAGGPKVREDQEFVRKELENSRRLIEADPEMA